VPGRTAHEAVENYLDPIRQAVRLLVPTAHLVGGPNFHNRKVNESGYWRLGEENGLLLASKDGRVRRFHAEQAYRIIESEPQYQEAGKFRVTTLEYAYELVVDNTRIWKMHWHPEGRSDEWRAHYHLSCGEVYGEHLPSGRHTIEDAVEWCIQFGATAAVDDEDQWREMLSASKAKHEQHRAWGGTPTVSTKR
jgi:hypothetical protein